MLLAVSRQLFNLLEAHLHYAVFRRYLRGAVLYCQNVAFILRWKTVGVMQLESRYLLLLFLILQNDDEGRVSANGVSGCMRHYTETPTKPLAYARQWHARQRRVNNRKRSADWSRARLASGLPLGNRSRSDRARCRSGVTQK